MLLTRLLQWIIDHYMYKDYFAYQLRHTLLQQRSQRDPHCHRRERNQGTCHTLQLCSLSHCTSHCMPQSLHYCTRTEKEQLDSQLQSGKIIFTIFLIEFIYYTLGSVFSKILIISQQWKYSRIIYLESCIIIKPLKYYVISCHAESLN